MTEGKGKRASDGEGGGGAEERGRQRAGVEVYIRHGCKGDLCEGRLIQNHRERERGYLKKYSITGT